jgi:hypothetical protein
LAFVIYLPNLYWQWQHDWATLRFISKLNREQMSHIPPSMFLLGQVLYMNPVNLPVWGAGLGFLLGSRQARPFRLLGWVFVTILTVFLITRAKVYYLAPAYTVLFAAGGVAFERGITRSKRPWLKPATVTALIAGGLWLGPIGLPVLSIDTAFTYAQKATGGIINSFTAYEITGDWRDQYGWEEHAATVANVFRALPPEEQAICTVFARNYGQASAINVYGRKYGLPPAVSTSMSYYYWGPGGRSDQVVIAYGMSREELDAAFAQVTQEATIVAGEVKAMETNLPVYVCRKPRQPLRDLWFALKPGGF